MRQRQGSAFFRRVDPRFPVPWKDRGKHATQPEVIITARICFGDWFGGLASKRENKPIDDPLPQPPLGAEVQFNTNFRCVQQAVVRNNITQSDLGPSPIDNDIGPEAVGSKPRFGLFPSAPIREPLMQVGFQPLDTDAVLRTICE